MAKLKQSRGRGNQGDWVNNSPDFSTLKLHAAHNAAVEARRQAKQAAKKLARSK